MGHLRDSARRGRRRALSAWLVLLAAAAPCSGRTQPAHSGQVAPAARVPTAALPAKLVSDGGAFTLELASSPRPIRLNEYFEVDVVVHAASSEARSPLAVTATAQMPAHRHGMNTRPESEGLGDGRFVLRGFLFHMAGEWEVAFEIAQGRVRERATARLAIE